MFENIAKKVFLIMLAFAPGIVNAATYYVSPTGSDSYTTTQAQNPATS